MTTPIEGAALPRFREALTFARERWPDETAAMQHSTGSLTAPAAQSEGLAGRRFAKAKPIAARLGICTRTLFRWADAGMIARHQINAHVG